MTLLIVIIILALVFDYINGFHDAANSIATIVSTKVLTPFQAVLWAATFNFVAFFIAKYLIGVRNCRYRFKNGDRRVHHSSHHFSGLVAAITWNLLTWWLGIPSSSSHTLIGGFAGAAIAKWASFTVIKLSVIAKLPLSYLWPLWWAWWLP